MRYRLYDIDDGVFIRFENDGAYIMSVSQSKEKVTAEDEIAVLRCIYDNGCVPVDMAIEASPIDRWEEKGFIAFNGEEDGTDEIMVESGAIGSGEGLPTRTSSPIYMTIGITSECNYQCAHCGNESTSIAKSGSLSPDEIYRVLDEMIDLPLLKINFTGGEPTLDGNLLSYMRYVKGKIPRITMTSNGSMIDKGLALALSDAGCNMVKLSIDGMSDFHDGFRGVDGAWDKAVGAVYNLSRAGIEVRVQSTLTNRNGEDILELAEFLSDLGVTHQSVVPVCPIGRAERDLMLDPKAYKEFLYRFCDRIGALQNCDCSTHYQMRPVFGEQKAFADVLGTEFETLSMKHSCEALKNTMEIRANGDVVPCSFLEDIVGNVRDSSLVDIWNGRRAIESFSRFHATDKVPECASCKRFESCCNGGCLANKVALGCGVDPYCFVR